MSDDDIRDKNIVTATFTEFSEDDCLTMAAALSYYTAFALPPLLLLIVTVAGWIWSPEAVTGQIRDQVSGVIGSGGWQQIETMMNEAASRDDGRLAAIVGIAVLIFGATGVMAQLQHALNRAWQVEVSAKHGGIRNFIFKRMLSLGMILGIAFLLIVSLVLTAVLNATADQVRSWLPAMLQGWTPLVVHALVTLVILTLLFAAMFKWLPDAEVEWRDTWIGAGATAVLFLAAKFALGVYFGMQDAQTYGPAASFVLILLWVYYSSIVFLLGAEFTQVWARRRGARITPSPGAVRIVQTKQELPG
ncbi:MAG: YihY/virulence factor BrkB family protein [Planctomycetaceae bacterium]